MRSWLRWLGLFLLALLLGMLLFYRLENLGVIATLDGVDGVVERDRSGAIGRFETAELGSRFRAGDAVRTGPASTAVLILDDESRVALEADTLLRFLTTPPAVKARGFELVTGGARLDTGTSPLELYTNVGLARLEPGTSVAIAPRSSGLRFSVRVGLARFDTKDGSFSIGGGQELAIDIGGAVLEREPRPAARNELEPREPSEREPSERDPTAAIPALVAGAGVKVRASAQAPWRPLPSGSAELAPGSWLQIPAGSRVALTAEDGRVSLQGKGQFTIGAPGAAFVQTTAGRFSIDRGRTPVSVAVPGGSITIRAWSRADGTVDAARTRLRVEAGSAEVLGALGRGDVQAGERATLLGSGRLDISGRGPAYADMIAPAGTSFVVHDPSPPTSVGFLLRDVCASGGKIETLAGSRVLASARGEESANILLSRGTHRYQVRCFREGGAPREGAEKPSASGVVTILRDSGTGVLSKIPPKTRIDTDGRSYTVMYQNLLPEIVVRWPKAPAASSYVLTMSSRRGTSTLRAAEPTLTFKTGQLEEGTHTLTFSVEGRSSAPTKLAIAFDNAAPTARIQSPQDGSFQLGTPVNVAGVAVPGWRISVAGRELAMDDQARFSDQVTVGSAQQALQLSFTHPRRGVHYYLRHAAGSVL